MARPRVAGPTAAALRARADAAGRLALRVTPGAAADAIALPDRPDDPVAVRTTAAPEDGKANAAVLRLLADALGCAPSRLALLRGATGRSKLVQLPPED